MANPQVNVKPVKAATTAGATPPAADPTAADPTAAPTTEEGEQAAPEGASDNSALLTEAERLKLSQSEGPGVLVVVARKARFRCPHSGVQFPENQKVVLKKDEISAWVRSQIAAGVLEVTQDTTNDKEVPDLR